MEVEQPDGAVIVYPVFCHLYIIIKKADGRNKSAIVITGRNMNNTA